MDIQAETHPILFGAIDTSDRLTAAATFDLFQETAINHAENLGVGREALVRSGQGWVLSRISVQWDRRPAWREEVTVRSWPRGWEKLFALRDYDIRDAEDKPIVRGRSGWIVLDIEKRRPLRPQTVMEKLPLNDGINALPGSPVAVDTRADYERLDARISACIGERKAAYSDIDYNGHMNNTRYIQWIQDTIEPGVLEAAAQMRLDINYLSEVKFGDTVEIWSAPIDSADTGVAASAFGAADWAYSFEGRRVGAEGKAAAFRAELRIRKDK
ncbi:acyl-ACP thioesterase [Spirochaetia bacterium]|nr:acyl-ACP thioesterase [Spirochaetia bacterium]